MLYVIIDNKEVDFGVIWGLNLTHSELADSPSKQHNTKKKNASYLNVAAHK